MIIRYITNNGTTCTSSTLNNLNEADSQIHNYTYTDNADKTMLRNQMCAKDSAHPF